MLTWLRTNRFNTGGTSEINVIIMKDMYITIIIIIVIFIIIRPTSQGGAPDVHRSCQGPRLRAMRVRDPFPYQLIADKWGQD